MTQTPSSAQIWTAGHSARLSRLLTTAAKQAASLLQDMRGEAIEISVSSVLALSSDATITLLADELGRKLALVKQPFCGALTGTAASIIADEQSASLAAILIPLNQETQGANEPDLAGLDMTGFDITGLEAEAIAELGNILLNCALGELAQSLGTEIETAQPALDRGTPISVTRQMTPDDQPALLLRITVKTSSASVGGRLIFALDAGSMIKLQAHLNTQATALA
jgi:chemotaxis protein CheC